MNYFNRRNYTANVKGNEIVDISVRLQSQSRQIFSKHEYHFVTLLIFVFILSRDVSQDVNTILLSATIFKETIRRFDLIL